jgi:putative addiction module CopG family antidote
MSKVEKISIALTDEMLASVKEAVASGDYASSSEVIRHALRDWRRMRLAESDTHSTRPKAKRDPEKIMATIREIQDRVRKLPVIDPSVNADDWMYDENGLPH